MTIASEFARNLPNTLTPNDRADIEDVLEAAVAWMTDALPIEAFANVGTIASPVSGRPSSGYTRHVAVIVTDPTEPRRRVLFDAIEELIRFQGLRITSHGVFQADELHGVTIRYERRAA